MRSSRVCMRSSRVCTRSSRVWIRCRFKLAFTASRVITAWGEPNSSAGNSNLDCLWFNSLRDIAAAAPHRYVKTLITTSAMTGDGLHNLQNPTRPPLESASRVTIGWFWLGTAWYLSNLFPIFATPSPRETLPSQGFVPTSSSFFDPSRYHRHRVSSTDWVASRYSWKSFGPSSRVWMRSSRVCMRSSRVVDQI
jgi:hypothetical protein